MKMRMALAVLAGMALFPSISLAQGPGFNCNYASTYVELAICDSRELSRLDRVLNLEYAKAQNRLDSYDAADLAAAQDSWIARRDGCRNYGCVDRAYRTRIAFLRRFGR
jgi:uncharacterized protein